MCGAPCAETHTNIAAIHKKQRWQQQVQSKVKPLAQSKVKPIAVAQFAKLFLLLRFKVAIINAYLILTLKFQFEKNDKFNYITSVMFNAYSNSTLKFEKIKYFW